MSSAAGEKYFPKTLSKLNDLISKLEVRTGITQKTLKDAQDASSAQPEIPKTNPEPAQIKAPVAEKPQPKPQEQKPKKEEKPKKEASKPQEEEKQASSGELGPEEFAKLDIRVGKIVKCWKVIV